MGPVSERVWARRRARLGPSPPGRQQVDWGGGWRAARPGELSRKLWGRDGPSTSLEQRALYRKKGVRVPGRGSDLKSRLGGRKGPSTLAARGRCPGRHTDRDRNAVRRVSSFSLQGKRGGTRDLKPELPGTGAGVRARSAWPWRRRSPVPSLASPTESPTSPLLQPLLAQAPRE